MEELTNKQKIELHNLIYPKSLEKDNDIKVIEITDHLKDADFLILQWTDLKKISDWMNENHLWY